jgi:hypothetical protein
MELMISEVDDGAVVAGEDVDSTDEVSVADAELAVSDA